MECLRNTATHLSPLMGISCAVLCALSFGCEDMLLYSTSEVTHPALIFVFNSVIAFLISAFFFFAVLKPRLNFLSSGVHFVLVLLHGMLSCITQITITIAIVILGPGNAVAIFFTMPIFATLFDVLCVGQRCMKINFMFTILSFVGVVLVSRPSFVTGEEEDEYLQRRFFVKVVGVVCGIIGAMAFSGALFAGRKLAELETDTIVTVLSYSSQYSVVSITLCTVLNAWRIPRQTETIIALSATGLISLCGMALHYLAVSFESPVTVSVILTLHVVFAYAGQYIFFTFPFHWTIGIGSALIMVSCVGVTMSRHREQVAAQDEEKEEELLAQDTEEKTPILE